MRYSVRHNETLRRIRRACRRRALSFRIGIHKIRNWYHNGVYPLTRQFSKSALAFCTWFVVWYICGISHDCVIHPPRCNTIMREIPFFVTSTQAVVSHKFFIEPYLRKDNMDVFVTGSNADVTFGNSGRSRERGQRA